MKQFELYEAAKIDCKIVFFLPTQGVILHAEKGAAPVTELKSIAVYVFNIQHLKNSFVAIKTWIHKSRAISKKLSESEIADELQNCIFQ